MSCDVCITEEAAITIYKYTLCSDCYKHITINIDALVNTHRNCIAKDRERHLKNIKKTDNSNRKN